MTPPGWWNDATKTAFGWGFLCGIAATELLLTFALYGRFG
jgi:hypothetical protein